MTVVSLVVLVLILGFYLFLGSDEENVQTIGQPKLASNASQVENQNTNQASNAAQTPVTSDRPAIQKTAQVGPATKTRPTAKIDHPQTNVPASVSQQNRQPKNLTGSQLNQNTSAAQQRYEERRKQMIAAQYASANEDKATPSANTETPTTVDTSAASAEQTKNQENVSAIYKNQTAPTPKPQRVASQNARPVQAPVATLPPQTHLLAGYPKIGTVNELPFSMQQKLPTIMYREHNYRDNPPSVLLNSKNITRGQMVEPNLYLEEILQDGIILRYENNKFKMPRLNSWVNM